MATRRKPKAVKVPVVICDYCGKPARCVDSAVVYRQSYGLIWYCQPCGAWVGCHKNSARALPLGRLANAELRAAKVRAHAAFDPLWKAVAARDGINPNHARARGYRWLSTVMGTDPKRTHIGMFDVAQCARVVEICTTLPPKGGSA